MRTLGSGTASTTASLPGFTTTRAVGSTSTAFGAGRGSGSSPYVGDDVPGVASVTVAATNATTVTLTRSSTVASATVAWQVIEWGGPSWWNASWWMRYPIVVTSVDALPTNYSVAVDLDHAALVTAGRSLASGNDVRVVSFDGTSWTELDRRLDTSSSWNSASTRLWWRLPAAVAAGTATARVFL